ncbi:MAG: LysM peptidoglycan-binding domain-containing protein [Microthrixaceae bacterium]|nr:LysM peptidoglycan-binding domain-containing protein [Microthrixaceae bacterium]
MAASFTTNSSARSASAVMSPVVATSARLASGPTLRFTPDDAAQRRLVRNDEALRRTYLRRRLTLAVLALVAVLFVAAALNGGNAEATLDESASPSSYVVRSGDTMWSIVTELGYTGDRREAVSVLAEANGGSTDVVAGQRLTVPAILGSVR